MMEQERERGISTADLAAAGTEATSARVDDLEIVQEHDETPDRPPEIAAAEDQQPLLADQQLNDLRGRWDRIQTEFVDEPRRSVEEADALVAEVMHLVAQSFDEERSAMEQEWDSGSDVSTEDLRLALRRYRSFFGRLLSA
jgi:hypothetical protein